MKTLIRLDHAVLGYGKDIVLRDVSLEIKEGAFLPFVGPNGGGKTTLLRTILGLVRPLGGKIITPFSQKPAGYVPQHKSLDYLFPLTAKEIIEMGFYPALGKWKAPGAKEKKRLEEIVEELKLSGHLHKNYRDLSGGTKQKVLIARALASYADIFILDEPTSELDESSEKEVIEHLWRFVSKDKKTVLLAAHHGIHGLILRHATQVCSVEHGQVRIRDVKEGRIV